MSLEVDARIYVQLEMDKPLWHHVTIGNFTQAIHYENLPTLCFAYGQIRHKLEQCLVHQPMLHDTTVTQIDSYPLQNHLVRTDKDLASHEFGPWMLVARRTPKQRTEVRSKPVRTAKLTARHAETILHQTENGMMNLPTPPVEPIDPLAHTDHVNQSSAKQPDSDPCHHALLQNRFSHLADFLDDGLDSARDESTSLIHIPSMTSTSAALEEHVDVPHPHGSTITCTQLHISETKNPTLLHSSSSNNFNNSNSHYDRPLSPPPTDIEQWS